jgi:phage head maturation protease
MTSTPTVTRYVELVARHAGVEADLARRTIAGVVSPWNTYAHVSTGQVVAFAPGSLAMGDRVKLILDHDPTQPVGVLAGTQATTTGQTASFRVPGGPRGDAALLDASEGLRDGLSVGAEILAADETDEGLYVTAARVRHVALLSEPAYDDARVTAVAASHPKGSPVTVIDQATAQSADGATVLQGSTGTMPPVVAGAAGGVLPATAAPVSPPATTAPTSAEAAGGGLTLTAAGLAAGVPMVRIGTEPYPYAQPHHLGGPSFVRDAYAAMENPSSEGATRWRRAQMMAADAAGAALALMDAPPPHLAAATGDTGNTGPLAMPHMMPDRFVPLKGAKAPLWSALTKYGTSDFNSIMVPRTLTETGLSGTGADEVTPLPPGTITAATDTIVIEEVEGSYQFSRKLLMGSNPQIDRIAQDALDRAWLQDVEARAVAYFTNPANSTAATALYTDGGDYTRVLRALFAQLAAGTIYSATVVLPAAKEYIAAAEADDTTERPLLPYGARVNSSGDAGVGYESLTVQGVPLNPGPWMTADKSLVLDQDINAAVAWTTPVMNFRLEWTGDGNYKVLKLVKYSGVGFWSQYPGGVVVMTGSTPLPLGALGGVTMELPNGFPAGTPAAAALNATAEEPAKVRR